MRCVLILSILSLLCGGFVWSPSAEAIAHDKEVLVGTKEAADAVNAFALDIYAALASEDKGKKNLFFSPYSISSALAMTYGGAGGTTAAEMAKTLHFGAVEGVSIHASMKALQERFGSLREEDGILDVANRLWLSKEAELLPSYKRLLKKNYDSDVVRLDFLKRPEGARFTINAWVAQKTRDKIKDLLNEDDVKPATRLVLTNAIYFNSPWETPFDEQNTQEEPFHIGPQERKNVPMMHRTDFFFYREYVDLQLIKIPYKIPGFSMLVLLPRAENGFAPLDILEKKLTPLQLASWTAAMERGNVSLWLPRFKDKGRFPLKETLQKLGMNLAFTEKADFSGMVKRNDVFVDSVIHQSFIDLDEKGTEAAAATAVTMTLKATRMPQETKPIEFRADHPFVYFVTDDESGAILFMGRMMEP